MWNTIKKIITELNGFKYVIGLIAVAVGSWYDLKTEIKVNHVTLKGEVTEQRVINEFQNQQIKEINQDVKKQLEILNDYLIRQSGRRGI